MMNKLNKYILICLTFLQPFCALALDKGPELENSLVSSPAAEFRFSLYQRTQRVETIVSHPVKDEWQMGNEKSVPKAVLFSALIPGSGEIYTGSYLKGAAFLIIEAAALVGHFHYQNRGNDLESAFEKYADSNWVENDYWNWMSQVSGISRSDLDALRSYERQTFSHFLPEQKSQQYYENVGKYNQFVAGWVDFDYQNYTLDIYLSGADPGSELREDYTLQRKDANDNFQRATNLVTVVLFNHVLSMFDAAWTAKRYNRHAVQTRVRMQGMLYDRQMIPALNLGISW